MKKVLLITGILINITVYSQSLKNFSIGQKFSKGYALEDVDYGFINRNYSTTVGNFGNVELQAVANKDSVVYKIAFYDEYCSDKEMAKEFRLAVQKNYSLKFNAPKSKTTTYSNAFTNYQKVTVTDYERICNVGNIKYTLITTKKTTINPLDYNTKMIIWKLSFIITNTDMEKQQKQYSAKQERLKKGNAESNF